MIRSATPDDARRIAAFHATVWHQTYASLAPAEARAQLTEARRLAQWQAALADPGRQTWLAEDAGALQGLVNVGPPDPAVFGARGEIKHLYVARSARRQGLGARLLSMARAVLAQSGYAGAGLGVVRQNQAARAFYRAQGGREIGTFTDPGPLWRSDMVLVVWD
ncbi:MAG: GNAT family N-acetyltransferase [Rhodobacteraceae bacterium]|nr:GNAT family N-acetyltransferase [Paracoccaceae bacterium]